MTSPQSPRRRSLTKHLPLPLLNTAWLFAVYMFGEYGAAIYLIGVALIAAAWWLGARAALKAALPGVVAGRVSSYNEGRRDSYDEARQLVTSLREKHAVATSDATSLSELSRWTSHQLNNIQRHLLGRRRDHEARGGGQ